MKVLIAEDEAVSRLILERSVIALGHDCLVARDGDEAWALFEQAAVDAVISDWLMPGLDGLELCHRVRAHPRDGYTYFVLLTARSEKEHLLAGLAAGADDYLAKPLDRDELQARLIAAERVTSLYHQLAAQKVELERLNRQLAGQARTDPLTGLGNRFQLWEDLDALHERAARYGHRYALALCDVDRFKRYNDTYGHPAGDEVLRRVAGVLGGASRRGDRAYRYGGEEFLLLLPEQPPEGAVVAVERLRRAVECLAIPHAANPPGGVVTLSAGVTELPSGEQKDTEALLREADAALYRAKELGRNRVVGHGAPALDLGAPAS
jgi:diguanylate cyclase (GGDEF)-like protein